VWQQWAVKVATVFALTWLLSIAIPTIVVPRLWPGEAQIGDLPVGMIMALTAVSLYVSSLCANTVRAVVTSVVSVSFVLWLVTMLWSRGVSGLVAVISAMVVLLLGLAFVNHRPEPPPPMRIVRQLLSVGAVVVVGIVVLACVGLGGVPANDRLLGPVRLSLIVHQVERQDRGIAVSLDRRIDHLVPVDLDLPGERHQEGLHGREPIDALLLHRIEVRHLARHDREIPLRIAMAPAVERGPFELDDLVGIEALRRTRRDTSHHHDREGRDHHLAHASSYGY
jgi:hypothetical protein